MIVPLAGRICMMSSEDDKIFIDTNILIYANYSDARYRDIAQTKLNEFLKNNFEIWISRQVIREFLVYSTRFNFENTKMPISDLLNIVFSNFEQYHLADESENTTIILRKLIEKHELSGKKIHDANIVATMKAYNIGKLLTNNVKDFERLNDEIEIVPLIG
jgi:predicted nucleic acid-binding protein